MNLSRKIVRDRCAICGQAAVALFLVLIAALATHAESAILPNQHLMSPNASLLAQQELEGAKKLPSATPLVSSTFQGLANNRSSSIQAEPIAVSQLQQLFKQWLQQFGPTELTLGGGGSRWPLRESSLTWLHPWSEHPGSLLFTQCGLDHYHGDQTTLNFGIGHRWLNTARGTWGGSLFYDRLIQNKHHRLGFGLEHSCDCSSITLNGYMPLSDWHASVKGEQAKPSPGMDIRFTGYLPSYPRLGISGVGEYYRGCTLSPKWDPLRTSHSLLGSFGIEYTPVPLFRSSYHYRIGNAGFSEHRIQLTLNYRLELPLSQQLQSEEAGYARSLQRHPLSLVQRNNRLLLMHRPDDRLQIELPEGLIGRGGEPLSLAIKWVTSRPVKEWQLDWAGTLIHPTANPQLDTECHQATIQLPRQEGVYSLQLIARNPRGVKVESNRVRVTVQALSSHQNSQFPIDPYDPDFDYDEKKVFGGLFPEFKTQPTDIDISSVFNEPSPSDTENNKIVKSTSIFRRYKFMRDEIHDIKFHNFVLPKNSPKKIILNELIAFEEKIEHEYGTGEDAEEKCIQDEQYFSQLKLTLNTCKNY